MHWWNILKPFTWQYNFSWIPYGITVYHKPHSSNGRFPVRNSFERRYFSSVGQFDVFADERSTRRCYLRINSCCFFYANSYSQQTQDVGMSGHFRYWKQNRIGGDMRSCTVGFLIAPTLLNAERWKKLR